MTDTGPKGYTWTVTGTRQTTALLPDNTVGQIVEVSFQLGTGQYGKVTVPLNRFSTATVRDAIDAHAAELAAVNNLSG